ncbi:putative chorismate synthase [Finegoldia magna SY403409CC001050417]|uniref:chorismate synthase n=1 Tax=Finegoldia magna TaxID=1260 RepID=UPI00021A1A78|nr:chorismate synthase [Finegoldia magna]EGS31924.1 putative chorismate synthase [Finegoldia magna SY403409CC001050417]
MSSIGKLVKLNVWGESHGSMIGGVIDGVDPGIKIDYEKLRAHMKRRSPGKSNTTLRKESDEVEFVSGILNDTTTGAPLSFVIKNSDHHSKDYTNIYNTPRPSHADYPATVRYNGFNDINGSGHFSGRLTAVINVAGFIAKEILKQHDIYVFSHLYSLGDIVDERFDDLKFTDYSDLKNKKSK